MTSKISLIVTTFNTENYIEDALKSIKNQTLDSSLFEIILIDDYSTDKTLKNINSFNKNNLLSNLEIYQNDKNRGVFYSRNFGADKAKNEILFYLDGDDMIHETCLEKCLIKYNDPSTGFVYSDHYSVNSNASFDKKDESIIKLTKKPHNFEIKDYIQKKENWIGAFRSVKKDKFIPFNNLPYAEDADWILNLGISGVNFKHIPEGLYYWRRGINSISSRIKNEADYWHNKVFNEAKLKIGDSK